MLKSNINISIYTYADYVHDCMYRVYDWDKRFDGAKYCIIAQALHNPNERFWLCVLDYKLGVILSEARDFDYVDDPDPQTLDDAYATLLQLALTN